MVFGQNGGENGAFSGQTALSFCAQLRQSKACNDWGLNCTNGKDVGIAVSYAANGYMRHGWGGNNPDLLRGPMATYYCGWMDLKSVTMSQTSVSNVAATILLADRFSSAMQAAGKGDGGEDYTGNAFIWTGTGRDYTKRPCRTARSS